MFLLFANNNDERRGGAFDLVGQYATLEAAQAALTSQYYWWHIYDVTTNTVVDRSIWLAV